MRIAFHTLGCKVNQYETEVMIAGFKQRGHEVVGEGAAADAYVINTCTVTNLADRKSRQFIRRARKANPESVIVVTGCYAEVSPGEVAKIEGVDIVAGNGDKARLPDYLEEYMKGRANACGGEQSQTGARTRALIKVQDGCDRYCSYCIVPYARGGVRSRPCESIVREAEGLIGGGVKEIVLTGVNTALYGAEEASNGNCGIEGVIGRLSDIRGDFRIRLSSLEPTVIDADYVKRLLKYEKLCRHMHLSLQSGSDRILKLMNRRYSAGDYMKIVAALKDFDPDYGISTDMIAGFPGESEEDFNESLRIAADVDFCKIHVFKYSVRKGTAAAAMGGQISGSEKNARGGMLIKAGEESASRFFKSNIGKKKRVLIEEYADGAYAGYTENYIKVYIDKRDANDMGVNAFAPVRLTGLYRDGMKGEREENHETCFKNSDHSPVYRGGGGDSDLGAALGAGEWGPGNRR